MKDHRWHLANPSKVSLRRKKEIAAEAKPVPSTLHLKNLAFTVEEEQVKKLFSEYGEVTECIICRGKDGKSKGFGFVSFAKEEEAFTARMLHGTELDGREIHVSQSYRHISRPK